MRNSKWSKRIVETICTAIFLIVLIGIAAIYSAEILKSHAVVPGEADPFIYEDKVYAYNHDLINILCMGIDSYESLEKDAAQSERGQADAVYLISLNTKTRDVKVLSIPRDIMVPIEIYDASGKRIATQSAQLTLQYAYGKSEKESCKLMSQRVSDLLGNIPIHRYCALNFNAIPYMNDAVGGIEVTMDPNYVDASLATTSPDFRPGNTVLLQGGMSLNYLHIRDITTYASAAERMERQKNYIRKYIEKAKVMIKQEPKIIFQMYKVLDVNMITDINNTELLSLATYLKNMKFEADDIVSLNGTRIKGEKYEEVYIDDEETRKVLTEVFFEEVQ